MYVRLAESLSFEDPTTIGGVMAHAGEQAIIVSASDGDLGVIAESITLLGPAFDKGFITLQRLMQTLVQPLPKL